LDEEARVRPRQHDLRAFARQLDVVDERSDAIALAIALARDLLLLGQDRVGAAEVHDQVLLLEALHGAGRELALAGAELLVDAVTLGVAHALDDVLLRGLRGDAAELLGRQLREELVADLRLGLGGLPRVAEERLVSDVLDLRDDALDLEQLALAHLWVELRLDVLVGAERALGGRQHGLLERLDDDLAIDPLLLAHLLDDTIEVR